MNLAFLYLSALSILSFAAIVIFDGLFVAIGMVITAIISGLILLGLEKLDGRHL